MILASFVYGILYKKDNKIIIEVFIMAFRFIHCSDIHLGACLHQDDRYEDFFIAFGKIVDCALENQVDAFVLAGDFFHQRSIDAKTLSKASMLLMRLYEAKIPVIAIEGNHDKAFYVDRQSWLEFLNEKGLLTLLAPTHDENGYHIDSSQTIWETEQIRMIGLGYLGSLAEKRIEQMAQEIEPSDKATVVLLHAGINRLMAQDMSGISENALLPLKDNVDYIALGHIHRRYQIQEWAYNPGAPECVHVDEAKNGQKGCYLVEIEKHDKKVEFISIDHRPIFFIKVIVNTDLKDQLILDILDALSLIEAKDAILQISLQGNKRTERFNLKEVENEIKEQTGCLSIEIIDETQREMEQIEDQAMDRTTLETKVFDELAEEMGVKLGDSTAETLKILKQGLIDGEETDDLLQYVIDSIEVTYVD